MAFNNLSLNLKKGARKSYLRYKRRYSRNDKTSYSYLKEGQPIIVLGGVNTGKTRKLTTLKGQIERNGGKAIYIDAMLPLGDIVRGYEGRNLQERIVSLQGNVDKTTYILLDNADRITDSRKLSLVLSCLEASRNVVVACPSLQSLSWGLRRRLELKNAHQEWLGSGGQAYDLTLILIAVAVGFIALTGNMGWLLGAAATRYLLYGVMRSKSYGGSR